jgi:hypothetical protein
MSDRVLASRDLATVRCRVEEHAHGERRKRIAEHDAELVGLEAFEEEGVHCLRETYAEATRDADATRQTLLDNQPSTQVNLDDADTTVTEALRTTRCSGQSRIAHFTSLGSATRSGGVKLCSRAREAVARSPSSRRTDSDGTLLMSRRRSTRARSPARRFRSRRSTRQMRRETLRETLQRCTVPMLSSRPAAHSSGAAKQLRWQSTTAVSCSPGSSPRSRSAVTARCTKIRSYRKTLPKGRGGRRDKEGSSS